MKRSVSFVLGSMEDAQVLKEVLRELACSIEVEETRNGIATKNLTVLIEGDKSPAAGRGVEDVFMVRRLVR